MASTYIIGKAKLYRKDPTSGVYTAVPQCLVLAAPGSTQNWDDITNHDSVGSFEERVPVTKANRDLPMSIVWDVINIALHGAIYDDSQADPIPLRLWAILYGPSLLHGWGFSAYSTAPDIPLDFKTAIKAGFTLGVTGAVSRLTNGLVGLP